MPAPRPDLVIVTDAWEPQINGVVRTIQNLVPQLASLGCRAALLTPAEFRTFPCPTYPEIALAAPPPGAVGRRLADMAPDYIHIATEGPLGWAARRWCLATGRAFTTSYHTRFPEYLETRFRIPPAFVYALLRRFHNAGSACMVATPSLEAELAAHGFRSLRRWTRGVDSALFRPRPYDGLMPDLPRPLFLSVGRVAPEKNLPAFLDLDLPGSRIVVGDGPALAGLRRRYPEVVFLGARTGEELARLYAAADVFVFPSRTDTFGVVLLEALASGLPVAAYPVTGPLDIVGDSGAGVLSDNLRGAAMAALSVDRSLCRQVGERHAWRISAEQFLGNLVPALRSDAVAA
jgi:glycosyltransferase involved in cell wall biosynthesis